MKNRIEFRISCVIFVILVALSLIDILLSRILLGFIHTMLSVAMASILLSLVRRQDSAI